MGQLLDRYRTRINEDGSRTVVKNPVRVDRADLATHPVLDYTSNDLGIGTDFGEMPQSRDVISGSAKVVQGYRNKIKESIEKVAPGYGDKVLDKMDEDLLGATSVNEAGQSSWPQEMDPAFWSTRGSGLLKSAGVPEDVISDATKEITKFSGVFTAQAAKGAHGISGPKEIIHGSNLDMMSRNAARAAKAEKAGDYNAAEKYRANQRDLIQHSISAKDVPDGYREVITSVAGRSGILLKDVQDEAGNRQTIVEMKKTGPGNSGWRDLRESGRSIEQRDVPENLRAQNSAEFEKMAESIQIASPILRKGGHGDVAKIGDRFLKEINNGNITGEDLAELKAMYEEFAFQSADAVKDLEKSGETVVGANLIKDALKDAEKSIGVMDGMLRANSDLHISMQGDGNPNTWEGQIQTGLPPARTYFNASGEDLRDRMMENIRKGIPMTREHMAGYELAQGVAGQGLGQTGADWLSNNKSVGMQHAGETGGIETPEQLKGREDTLGDEKAHGGEVNYGNYDPLKGGVIIDDKNLFAALPIQNAAVTGATRTDTDQGFLRTEKPGELPQVLSTRIKGGAAGGTVEDVNKYRNYNSGLMTVPDEKTGLSRRDAINETLGPEQIIRSLSTANSKNLFSSGDNSAASAERGHGSMVAQDLARAAGHKFQGGANAGPESDIFTEPVKATSLLARATGSARQRLTSAEDLSDAIDSIRNTWITNGRKEEDRAAAEADIATLQKEMKSILSNVDGASHSSLLERSMQNRAHVANLDASQILDRDEYGNETYHEARSMDRGYARLSDTYSQAQTQAQLAMLQHGQQAMKDKPNDPAGSSAFDRVSEMNAGLVSAEDPIGHLAENMRKSGVTHVPMSRGRDQGSESVDIDTWVNRMNAQRQSDNDYAFAPKPEPAKITVDNPLPKMDYNTWKNSMTDKFSPGTPKTPAQSLPGISPDKMPPPPPLGSDTSKSDKKPLSPGMAGSSADPGKKTSSDFTPAPDITNVGPRKQVVPWSVRATRGVKSFASSLGQTTGISDFGDSIAHRETAKKYDARGKSGFADSYRDKANKALGTGAVNLASTALMFSAPGGAVAKTGTWAGRLAKGWDTLAAPASALSSAIRGGKAAKSVPGYAGLFVANQIPDHMMRAAAQPKPGILEEAKLVSKLSTREGSGNSYVNRAANGNYSNFTEVAKLLMSDANTVKT